MARLGKAPDTYPESFDFVADAGALDGELADAMKPAAGMRNVLAHAYLDVDHDLVAAAIPLALEHNRLYVGQVARWFRAGSAE